MKQKKQTYQPNQSRSTGKLAAILHATHYYPFGMQMAGMSYDSDNLKYLYNGKELHDDQVSGTQLNWYSYGARYYNPQIGRWMNIDPMAEKYDAFSPYNYCVNNPVNYVDPDGRYIEAVDGGYKFTGSDIFWVVNMLSGGASVGTICHFASEGGGGEYHTAVSTGGGVYMTFYSGSGGFVGSYNYSINADPYDYAKLYGGWHDIQIADDLGDDAFLLSNIGGSEGDQDIQLLENYHGVNYYTVKGMSGAVTIPEAGVFISKNWYNDLKQTSPEYLKALKQHEYGHILQYQETGSTIYWGFIAKNSLLSATHSSLGLNNHKTYFIEVDANIRAQQYFGNDASSLFGTSFYPTSTQSFEDLFLIDW